MRAWIVCVLPPQAKAAGGVTRLGTRGGEALHWVPRQGTSVSHGGPEWSKDARGGQWRRMHGRRGEGERRVSASKSWGDGDEEASRRTRAQNAQEEEGEVAS
jgi:hypothetical protein